MEELAVSSVLDDRPAFQDALDFAAYRETLAGILGDAHTQTPLTIGVFGSWGSGKTSLMNMIKAELDGMARAAHYTTWFNAWKYDREEALWRALILRVLDSLRPSQTDGSEPTPEQQGLLNDLDRLEESLYRTVEWEDLGRWTLDWAKALQGTTEGAAEIALSFVPGAASLINLLKKAAKAVSGKDQQDIADAFRREVKTHRLEQLRSLEQFEQGFAALLDRHVVQRGGRLIVFVDDLDRCLPEKTMQVLEAIKLFLDAPGCAFVLGLDEEAIVRAVHTRYGDQVKARQYLEKIIQLPFHLPPIESEHMRSFVNSLVPHLPDPRCSEVFAEGLPPNPRQVKRTANIFLLLWRLAQQRSLQAIQPVRLAKVVTLQHSFPDLYALLREVPGLLRDLELYLRAEAQQRSDSEKGTAEKPSDALPLPDLLEPFVSDSRLRRLLTLHSLDEANANFHDLTPEDIRSYIYLTRQSVSVSSVTETPGGVIEPQMLIVPAGEFVMGSRNAPDVYQDELPAHTLDLPRYALARYPVTNFEYRAFVRESGHAYPRGWRDNDYPEGTGDHPVTNVNLQDARAYCAWLSHRTGKLYRLPSEAEWEKAARGGDGRSWPWGNEWDAARCNSRESGLGKTTPAGQYSPIGDSPHNFADMAGNVWEWCDNLYQPYPYPQRDGPQDLDERSERVLRGGSFRSDKSLVRCAARYRRLPNSRDETIGFRVALTLSE